MLSQQQSGGMALKKHGGGAPATPMTPATSMNANFAAYLNTPQGLSSQLQRALGVSGLPTPPSTVQRTTVGLPTSASGQMTTPQSKPPNDPLFNPKNTTNVYVNNLPLHTPDEALFRLCSPYGKVLSVRVFHREDAPVPGSYGFVLFETLEDARRCIVALHRSRYQASFAKTTKVPNPLLADQLLLPFVGPRLNQNADDSSSLYVRGLAKATDQHTLELLFVPHFVISFRLGDELGDGSISWPTIEKEMGKENALPEQNRDVRWKVALVRLKDHDTAEEMIDKLDGAYVRGSETPLNVGFAEAGAWRRVGSNRPKSAYAGYSEEERLNDAGWVGVGLPTTARVQPSPAFFNMGLGTMGIQQQPQQPQQISRPVVGADQWISMSELTNMNFGGMNDLAALRSLQNLNGMNGLQNLANLQNSAGLANLMQSLNLNSQLGLSNPLPMNGRNALSNLDANALNTLGRQDLYGPALFSPPQLQSPVSIRNPNAPKASSPNSRQSNGTSDFRNTMSHSGAGGNPHMNNSVMGTPTSNSVRAPPPSPCSPQNGRVATGAVYTPQSFLSSLPAIPEAHEDPQQNQKLNEALAAQLLGTKSVPVVVEPRNDNSMHQSQNSMPAHLLTPGSSLPSSQPSSQTGSPPGMTTSSVPVIIEVKGNNDSAQILSQGMPAQRPRTPARGVGVAISMPSAPAAAHLSEKASGVELSVLMNAPPAMMKAVNSGQHAPISAPVPAAMKDDKSSSMVIDA
ncbi:hypothetical protein CALVIDRAFT_562103 [Calocera viscosa TUFC12733]|uniref:RRM domain-containing protein n=1 Tax=Calocera viscosa (strain TUFC12733) TaxID=1330018 RepID=A0A167PDF7_CALVF|nr:hypothetical protein CALVIDRAFT_562103 [Calocera viscosa TUFC12733]